MENWVSIRTDADAIELLDIFGGFHDACIREIHITTGHFVNDNLAMTVDAGFDTRAKILVQRQYKNPSCIVLKFEQIIRINIVPTPINYDSIIRNATLTVQNDCITWALDPEVDVEYLDSKEDTWITAKMLNYRVADEMLGPIKGMKY